MSQYNTSPAATPSIGIAAVGQPLDRIRWGAIWGGIFAALSTLILLGVLGMAIGLSAYDVGEDGRGFRLGAGIWSAVSAIVAFFIGGWLAGRSSAFRDRRHAVLNGAMVWAVAIPLVMILLSGGAAMIGSGLTANPNVSSRVDQPQAMAYDGEAQPAGARLGEALSPQLVQRTTDSASAAAWWTLVSLLLGLAAAALGGSLGARDDDLDLSHRESDRRPETPALT